MSDTAWEVILPCIMMVLDVITGYVAATCMGTVDSKKMKKGIYGKIAELFVIVLAFFLEFAFTIFSPETMNISVKIPIGVSVCAYVFLMELISIIENIGCINPKIGMKLIEILGISPDKVNLKEVPDDDRDE